MSGPAPLSSETTALLGPTNTGKTHHCIERMLEHESGMIGLPLRLLAREVYDKISERVGEQRVALVTGEEKRVPKAADYWVCTVEAMPNIEVDFLAVDEIQLIAHDGRGHVFTQRLLEGRGVRETWFMGSDTARPLLERLVPAAKFRRRPRLSKLSFAGSCSLGKLPSRSAVVAFNAAQVYELAERVKARRGGAAVVLGSLSPRTRNAQVAMFQAGEVDTLIATDAIGMGLNLSVRHVAFAGLRKFDGHQTRSLSVSELAQIAGRAGRHLEDGTFGTLNPCPPLSDGIAHSIEEHRFHPDRHAVYRNSDLDFSSLLALLASLGRKPPYGGLRLVQKADDTAALMNLAQRKTVQAAATSSSAVQLLWQVCQVPDYRKLLPEAHAELLHAVYLQLVDGQRLEEDWVNERIKRLDDTGGDLETLMGRLSFVRTWTYISHQPGWLRQAGHWQERTRQIEDRLSDALHDRLVQRFVERSKKGVPQASPRPRRAPATAQAEAAPMTGPFAQLARLREQLSPVAANAVPDTQDVETVVNAKHEDFSVQTRGTIRVGGHDVGRLRRGAGLLHPEVLAEAHFPPGARARVERRLRAFVKDLVEQLLAPLRDRQDDSAAMRGLLYQLRQGLGSARRVEARQQLSELSPMERGELKQRGLLLGRDWLLCAACFESNALRVRQALCSAFYGLGSSMMPDGAKLAPRTRAPAQALMSLGYARVGDALVRCDAYEQAVRLSGRGAPNTSALSELLGCAESHVPKALTRIASPGRRRRGARRRTRE